MDPSNPQTVRNLAPQIKLVVFDVDGVLTDGKLYYASDGNEIKAFHVQDGSAMKRLQRHGIAVAIVTGRESPMVERRARELGIRHVYQGQESKVSALQDLLRSLELPASAVACVGDDLADLDLFQTPDLGLAIAVPNAHPLLRKRADYVTTLAGGAGVARELTSLLLGADEYRAPD